MPKYRFTFYMALLPIFYLACNSSNNKTEKISSDSAISCEGNLPSRSSSAMDTIKITPIKLSHEGMVFINGGEYMMGAGDNEGRPDEYPQHKVKVDGFWMDATEVTNAQFKKFTDATGYITTAEKKPDWEEMKKQLPPGSAKPGDDILVAASLVFTVPGHPVSLNDASQWWVWKKGANWKHPQGAGSNINEKDNYPVVHISWDDAMLLPARLQLILYWMKEHVSFTLNGKGGGILYVPNHFLPG